MEVSGVDLTLMRLQNAPKKLQRSSLRKAGNRGSVLVLRAMKAAAPVDSGLLKKSLGRKVKVFQRGNAATLFFIVGPRTGFKKQVGTRKRSGKAVFKNPVRYAHLADKRKPFRKQVTASTSTQVAEAVRDAVAESLG